VHDSIVPCPVKGRRNGGGKALARMRVSGKKVKRAPGRWNLKRGSQLPTYRDHQKATRMCSEFHDLYFCSS
jgi:hypothetical protein